MKHIKRRKQWHPTKREEILLAITCVIAIASIVIIAAPAVASLGTERIPERVPLVRTFPVQP
jgi:hypothetical protein